ncbi:MAG: acyl carrier protein [Eubacteriales bacterium]|nr:acyl carrier protein [Eubacteriales bacterium]
MEELKAILSEIRPDIDFDEEKHLIDDGILDSFDIISIVGEVNTAFDVEINVEDLLPENFNSMQAMYDLICKLQDE